MLACTYCLLCNISLDEFKKNTSITYLQSFLTLLSRNRQKWKGRKGEEMRKIPSLRVLCFPFLFLLLFFPSFSLEDNEPPTVPANDGHLKFNLPN